MGATGPGKWRTVAGLLLSVAVLGGFFLVFDAGAMWRELEGASLGPLLVGFGAVLLALACWAESMRRILLAAGGSLSAPRAFVAYATGMFAKQVVPMGNAGGVPIMAFAFDRETTIGYNRNLAVVTIGDFLGLLASLLLAVIGVGYVLLLFPGTHLLQAALVGVAVFAAALLSVAVLLLYRRRTLRYLVLGVAHLLRGTVGRVTDRIEARLAPDVVTASLERYFGTVDTVRADSGSLLVATGLSFLGWTAFAVPLYTAAMALGRPISFGLVLFIIPIGAIATLVPLPGGLGGVEFAIAGMVVAMTGMDLAAAGTVVILYRLAVFWFLLLVGALAVGYTGTSLRSLAASEEHLPAPDRN